MENVDPSVLNTEIDIDLYTTTIYMSPLFWVFLLIGNIVIIMLWKRHKLRGIITPIAAINVFSSLIGSMYYDGFIKDIYHGGYELDFGTVSGVCFIISVSTLFLLFAYLFRKGNK